MHRGVQTVWDPANGLADEIEPGQVHRRIMIDRQPDELLHRLDRRLRAGIVRLGLPGCAGHTLLARFATPAAGIVCSVYAAQRLLPAPSFVAKPVSEGRPGPRRGSHEAGPRSGTGTGTRAVLPSADEPSGLHPQLRKDVVRADT